MQKDDKGQNVMKAGIWYTVGNVFVKGIAFLTLPVFTLLMRPEQYGLYNTYAAYASVIAVIVSLGLPSSVRNVRYDMPKEEQQYHINAVVLIGLTFCVLFSLSVGLQGILSELFGIPAVMLQIVVVNSTCTALLSYYNQILTIDFRYHEFLKLSFFYSFTSVLLSILLITVVFRENTALGRAVGCLIPMVIIAGYVILHIWKRGHIALHRNYTRYGIRFGIPLIPNDLSALILAQFDRIMIYRSVGESESGLYSFAYNVAVIYQVITASIESAWTPWMFSRISEKDYEGLCKKISVYMVVLSYGTSLLLLGSPEGMMLLSARAYWEGRTVVIPILLSMYFFAAASIPLGIAFFHKKTGWISGCTCCTAVCNILLNLLCIPIWGYQAAAYTTLVCYFLYAVLHMLMAVRLEPIHMLQMPWVTAAMLCTTAAAVFGKITLAMPWIRWSVILCLIVGGAGLAYRSRKQWMQLTNALFTKRK